MNVNEKDIDLLDRYYAGELQETETEPFFDRLNRDAAFRQTAELYEVVTDGIRHDGRRKLKERLEQFHEERKPGGLLQYKWYAVAASVVLMVFAGLWVADRPGRTQLFEEYFQPYPDVVSTRDMGSSASFAQAMEAYNSGDFSAALTYFKTLPHADHPTPAQSLYTGICLLAVGQPDTALAYFEPVRHEGSPYNVAASWYRSMAYLRLGNYAEFDRTIRLLEGTSYETKARQLRARLSTNPDKPFVR